MTVGIGNQITQRCVMCGAEPDQPCTVISGDGTDEEGDRPGDPRDGFHFYR